MVDGVELLHLGHGLAVDGLAHDVPNTAERLGANGHLHGLTGIGGDEAALQAVGRGHGDRADDAGARGAREVDGNDAGIGDIVGVAQQLLCQLATALAHGHGTQGAVAGVRVGTQDHLAAAGEVLTHKGMDDRDVRRDKDAAVLFGSREAKDVVVLVDGATHGTQRVMAVGKHVGQRETFHTGRFSGLYNTNKGNIVRG